MESLSFENLNRLEIQEDPPIKNTPEIIIDKQNFQTSNSFPSSNRILKRDFENNFPEEKQEELYKKPRIENEKPPFDQQKMSNLKSELTFIGMQTCDVKTQKINVLKHILENQNQSAQSMQSLKEQLQYLTRKEQQMCQQMQQLVRISKNQNGGVIPLSSTCPSSPIQSTSGLNSISYPFSHVSTPPSPGPTPCSLGPTPCSLGSTPCSPKPVVNPSELTPCPGITQLQKIWSGNLSLENCPHKGKSRDISVIALAPNVCSPNIAPLVAQFEATPASLSSKWPLTLKISGVCYSNNLHFFKKYSLGIFILFPDSRSKANIDTFQFLLQQLSRNSWAGVVDLCENTLLLVPFKKEKLLGILLTKMNVTLAPKVKPTLSETSDFAISLSMKYYKEGELKFDDKIVNGFYDPGRSSIFLPLEEYQRQSVQPNMREIILIDPTKDNRLNSITKRASEMISKFTDIESQARVLALFVSNCFGGDFPCTESCMKEMENLKKKSNSNIILLGNITQGVCRHRSILYKYLCDKLCIDCELRRGNYCTSNQAKNAHAWNVIRLGMQFFVVDIMHEPTQLYPIDSEKAKNYITTGGVGEDGLNYNVVRPELSSTRFIRLPNLREKPVFHERLGRGGYGSVYRITLGGLACALKKVEVENMSEQQKKYALQEVQIMETLQHENIVHYLGHELAEDKKELHILMELFPLSLRQLVEKRKKVNQPFTTLEIKHLAIEILNGIDYLHNNKIIHRDLKGDNILVDMDNNGKINKVKITDFGVCKDLSKSMNDCVRVGTELYMAPEVHEKALYTEKSDIWSFGMVLVQLLTMSPPYYGLQKEIVIQNIKSGVIPTLPENSLMPSIEKIKDIIKSCLQFLPDLRPTAEQLIISFFRLQCRT